MLAIFIYLYSYQIINELLRGDLMGKKKMSSKSASRIQSHADRSGKNQGFKARAQRAANKNKKK